jgi:chloramphenicol O-acetyltransferase type B
VRRLRAEPEPGPEPEAPASAHEPEATAAPELVAGVVRVEDLVPFEPIADPLTSVGRGTYGVRTSSIRRFPFDEHAIRLGKYCSVAEGVTFLPGGEHRPDWVTTYPFVIGHGHPASRGPIVIGNDVWIGFEALVLSGVTIGDGAVIGARSVVTRDVRPYAIVAGHPAVERRRRFSDEQVAALLAIRWWDWPEEDIEAVAPLLCSDGIDEFIRRFSDGAP